MHTYDGDTPQDARRTIRTRAHVVLSNPDMLHSGILPHHPRWAKLFENLRYIVIDELHAYRGVFGSHLCNVLRRLRRICRHYGSESAVHLLVGDHRQSRASWPSGWPSGRSSSSPKSGAPRGEKFFVFVNPPVVNRELGIRRSYLAETRRVAGEFLRRNLQVIVFAQSRLSTEILTTYLKEDFEDVPGMPELIRGYRGGYLPLRRREIETRAARRAGARRGLDQRARARHRHRRARCRGAGRLSGHDCRDLAARGPRRPPHRAVGGGAGRRRARRSTSSSSRHPSYFFDASPEHALINPDNLHILVDHVKCAAFELPFTTEDTFGEVNVQEVLGVLQEAGLVHRSGAIADGRRADRAVALDERIVSGRCRQPALDLVGQLRRRRSDGRRRR